MKFKLAILAQLTLLGALRIAAYQGSCPSGYLERDKNDCYRFDLPPASWSQARQNCKTNSPEWVVDLVVFDSNEEYEWVINTYLGNYLGDNLGFWAGVYYDTNEAKMLYVNGTIAGTLPKDVPYMTWVRDFPDGDYRFAAYGIAYDAFYSGKGSVNMNYVCELKQIQSGKCDEVNDWRLGPDGDCHKLAIFPAFENWFGAKRECENRDAKLVIIRNNETNFHLYSLPPLNNFYPPNDIWLGGKTVKSGDQVYWTWIDGSNLTYSDWSSPDQAVVFPNDTDADNYCIKYRWRAKQGLNRWIREKCAGNFLDETAQAWCSRPLMRCLSKWKENDKVCYFLLDNKLTWDAAKKSCESLQARLVVPSTEEKSTFLKGLLPDFAASGNSYVWVGLNQPSQGSFEWNWVGNSQEAQPYWMPDEKDKPLLNRGCAVMDAYNKNEYWSSTSCKDSNAAVCEVKISDPSNQPDPLIAPTKRCETGWTLRNRKYCYLYQALPKDWSAANYTCATLGANLVQIKSDEEQHAIMTEGITDSKSDFWIGLRRKEGTNLYSWRNEDYKSLDFTNWDDITTNTISSGLCGIAYTEKSGRHAGRWDMRDCATTKPYMCIKEATLSAFTTTAKPSDDDRKYCGGNAWESDQYSNNCYQYHEDGDTTWESAQFVCSQNGGNVLSITDPTERAVIQARISRTLGVAAIWIGLNTIGSANYYNWADGSPTAYFNWNKGQPNRDAGQCVKMAASTGVWSTESCTAKYGYICKKPKNMLDTTTKPMITQQPPPGQDYVCKSGYVKIPGTTKCVTLILSPSKYDSAKSACVKLGGNLAIVDNAEENLVLLSLFYGAKRNGWIGLEDTQVSADEMYFKWVDGSTVKYTNWEANEPLNGQSNTGERQDCVLLSSTTGKWNDELCSYVLDGYFCSVPAKIGPVVTQTPPVGCPRHSDIFPASTYSSYCYYFSWQQTLNQTGASEQCKSFGGNLVSILDQQEQTFLATELLLRGYELQFYTGLYGNREGTTWPDGSRVTFYNFAPGVVLTASNVCGTIGGGGEYHGLWYTAPCSTVLPYICKVLREGYTVKTTVITTPYRDRTKCSDLYPKDPTVDAGDFCYVIRGGTTYLANTYQVSFSKSSSNCRQLGNGASLATIQNSNLNNLIFQSANSTNYAKYTLWIGLSSGSADQGFQWADGDAFYYNNFAIGQPSLTTKACAYMNSNGLWYTSDCNQYRNYVCMVYKPDYYVNATTRPLFTADPEGDKICGGGGNWALNNDTCYWVSSKVNKNWYDANSYCQTLNATLVSIVTEGEQNYLTAITRSYVASEVVWTGLNELDRDSYKWVDGSPVSYLHWDDGQPNDEYGAQLCVAMRSATGKWLDEDCTVGLPFICKKSSKGPSVLPTQPPKTGSCPPDFQRFGEKCFLVNTGKLVNAETARSECAKLGRSIYAASLLTKAEQNFLSSLMRSTKAPVWIGLVNKREQSAYDYRWVSEEPFTFDNWASNQPPTSIIGPTYNCVAMRNETTQVGRWYEESCTRLLHYACSTYISGSSTSTDGCKPGFTRSGNSCWQISISDNDVPQWYDAPNRCATSQSELATISDVYDQAFLDSQLASVPTSKNIWIGLSTLTGTPQWISGWPVLYTNWNYNQPSISDRYPCGYLNTTTGKWFVGACNQQLGYICRDTKTFNDQAPPIPEGDTIDVPGSCPSTPAGSWTLIGSYCYYVNVTVALPFSSAVTHCLSVGGGTAIASIPSRNTNDRLFPLIEQQFLQYPKTANNPWIGYVQSGGNLESVDGTPVTFVNWQNGVFPETSSSEPECVLIEGRSDYWLLENCAASRGVICRQLIPGSSATTTKTTARITRHPGSASPETNLDSTLTPSATESTADASGDSTLTILLIVGAVFGVISGVAMLAAIYYARTKPHIMPQWFVNIVGKSNSEALVGDKPMGMENEVYASSQVAASDVTAAPDAAVNMDRSETGFGIEGPATSEGGTI